MSPAPARPFTTCRGALACLVLAARAASGQTFTDLGILPGTFGTYPTAMSADGSTVVGYCLSGIGFRWTAATGLVDIGQLPGTIGTQPTAVNADGTVIVGFDNQSDGMSRAFRWTASGGMQDLAAGIPHNYAEAFGVSADGSVVVGDISVPGVNVHAFRWTAQTGVTDLTPPTSAGAFTGANAVNADGTIAVGTVTWQAPARSAMFQGGLVDNLDPATTSEFTYATAVSADGSVVAGNAHNPLDRLRMTRWTAATGTVNLGSPDAGSTEAIAISPDGAIIAGRRYTTLAPLTGAAALLWSENTGFVDVRSYLLSRGVNLDGWTLTAVRGLTNDATTMVGEGNVDGFDRAWIVTGLPPFSGGCSADLAGPGGLPPGDGLRDNNDFIAFINYFFARDPRADFGHAGGQRGGDGAFDNNDFIAFINQFFAPCP